MSTTKNYHWRIAGFYFFYYAFVGMFSPYWGLYLKSIHFDVIEISILMSIQPVMRMLAPSLWGWLADGGWDTVAIAVRSVITRPAAFPAPEGSAPPCQSGTGKRLLVVQVAATLSALFYLGVFVTTSFWGMFIVLVLMAFFWSASMPLVEATTLSYLGKNTSNYGRIRSWGSIGFIVTVLGLGYAFDYIAIAWLLWAGLVCEVGILIFSRQIPHTVVQAHQTDRVATTCAGLVRRVLLDVGGTRSLLHLLFPLSGRTRLYQERSRGLVGAGGDLRNRRVFCDARAGAALRLHPHPAHQLWRGRVALSAHRLDGRCRRLAVVRASAARADLRCLSRRLGRTGA
jgi:MFS family permease